MLLTSVGWLSYTAINLREYRLLHVFVVIVGVRETKLTGETVHVFLLYLKPNAVCNSTKCRQ